MAFEHIVSGIDVGNSHVKVVVAKVSREAEKPEIIGAGSAPSNGIRKGTVVDMEEAIESIRAAVQQAQAMAQMPIRRAYLSINGLHVQTQTSRGVIAVSRADNEISQHDIDRVLQAASVVSLPPNREIIHVLPRDFIVDGTEHVRNPLGMKGVRLEAEVCIIDGLSPYLRNIAKCVHENNIEVAGLIYAPLAASLAALDKSQREFGVLHLDFGGGTSSMAIFEEADLVHSAMFPIGSRHITNDLAIALRTSMDVAEQIKLEHGATSEGEDLRRRENIDLTAALGEDFVIPRKQLIRVVDARIDELVEMVGAELKKISRSGTLPAGIVLSGGGANLPGLLAVMKERLRLPVKLAKPVHVGGVLEIVADPSYVVAVGLALWGIEQELGGARQKTNQTFIRSNGLLGKVGDWLKNFMP